MIFTTSINLNYLPKARTLAQSVKRFYPESKFYLCMVEKNEIDISNLPEFDKVIYPFDFWPSDHERILYKYEVVEACTAVKGELFCYMLDTYKEENIFIYLDPDIQVFSPMDELLTALNQAEIVLTPHLTEPEEERCAILDNEVSVARHGVFNLGFLAIKRGPNAQQFLRWWGDRLKEFSFADYFNGLFTDQKWVDQAPAFFDVFIFKNPGYNVAPWNIAKRNITEIDGSYCVNSTFPLRFFHFSGLDSGANLKMLSRYADQTSSIFRIRTNYLNALAQNGEKQNHSGSWSYDIFNTNFKFIKKARRLYQRNYPIDQPYQNSKNIGPIIFLIKDRIKKVKRALKG
jgi:hypothetical protein